jgi:hypothetical protein
MNAISKRVKRLQAKASERDSSSPHRTPTDNDKSHVHSAKSVPK